MYDRNLVLDNLDLKIGKEFITIFGANGSGKTTLLKIISTLIKPTSGEILIDGLNIFEEGIKLREKIGFLGHEIYLYEELTAIENLKFYSKLYNIPKDKFEKEAYDLLKTFGLLHRMNDYVRKFSRGMKQRLSIARAILHNPKILLLDEPYTGLDNKAKKILEDFLLNSIGKKTIIMTSHNIEKFKISEKTAFLANGKIVFCEISEKINLDELLEKYRNLEVRVD